MNHKSSILLSALLVLLAHQGAGAGDGFEGQLADAIEAGDGSAVFSRLMLPATLCVGGSWRQFQTRSELDGVKLSEVISDPSGLAGALRGQRQTSAYASVRPSSVHGEKFYQSDADSLYVTSDAVSRILPRDYRRCGAPKVDICADPKQNEEIAAKIHLALMLGMNVFELPSLSGRRNLGYQSNSDYKVMGFRFPFAAEDWVNENLPRGFNQLELTYDPSGYLAAPKWTVAKGRQAVMVVPSALWDLPPTRGCQDDQEVCDFSSREGFQHADELYGYSSLLYVKREKNGSCSMETFYMRDLYPETVAAGDLSLRRELAEFAPRGVAKLAVTDGKWPERSDPSLRLSVDGAKIRLRAKGHNYVFESFANIGSARLFGIWKDPAGRGPLHEMHVYLVPEDDDGGGQAQAVKALVMKKHYMEADSKVYTFVRAR